MDVKNEGGARETIGPGRLHLIIPDSWAVSALDECALEKM